MWDNLTVSGFSFNSASDYEEARKEAEAIEYICLKMNLEDPQIALKVYYKLLERKNLHTVVGLDFLSRLRADILKSGIIEEENLKYIHADEFLPAIKPDYKEYGDEVALEQNRQLDNEAEDGLEDRTDIEARTEASHNERVKQRRREENAALSRENDLKYQIEDLKLKIKKRSIVILALVVIILAMFGVTLYGGASLDSEVALQDKYSSWAEELNNREKELEAREAALEQSQLPD